ncbi:MAG: SUMF1/EgtB/PvdO family nonheme iron enzyme [Candidatus Cloacimonadales bacterium]|jgi:formylglycine-generating enzyme required for sulfatase activity|nr:SUMF1/EgtB/PvdO family nonheme iron enzyme [Candidatus Cloacimonadales bacterium]
MKIRALIIVLLAMFVVSCTEELTFENPFDPATDISYWTPKNLIITPQSPTSIKLSWEKVNGNYQGFKISRKVGSGAWQNDIATVGANTNQWTDSNANIGNTYTYRVKAYAGANNSNYVEKTQAFTLSTPTNLSITPQSATSLKLTWTDTNQFEQGYKISRKVGSGVWQDNIATVGANTNQWTDNTINATQVFQYKVRAYYQNYYSDYSNSAVSPFAFVQGGTFQMGSTSGGSDENPVHSVTVSSFFIGKYQVTQKEWLSVMGNNPSNFKGDNRPVEQVTWYDAVEYCNKLSKKEGLTPAYTINGYNVTCNWSANGYRLPTEAEWEYAARGGNKSKGYTYSGSNTVDNVAWCSSNSNSQTYDVGTKAPNELGIYDMSGNVWEWCWDWYSSSYYSSSPANNPTGPSSGSYRVDRGGSWGHNGHDCRVARRSRNSPGNSRHYLGLRVLRTIQ